MLDLRALSDDEVIALIGETKGYNRELLVEVLGADEFADEVVDDYLLELWPASLDLDAIVRIGSENARHWHEEWGGRR